MAGSIDSPRNARVLAARALLTRKGRVAAASFLVEGPHAVSEVLASPRFEVRELFVTDEAAAREVSLLRRISREQVPVHTVTARVLRSIGDTVTPQGIVAIAAQRGEPAGLPEQPRLVAILDQCSDPGNAGTAIRTSTAAGADAVVVTPGSVDVWSGKCIRASAGTIFRAPVVTAPLSGTVAGLRAGGVAILATSADGDADLDVLIEDGSLSGPTAWLFGNEARGLSEEARDLADRTVRVPLYGPAESLNLAAAVAICLYTSARCQRAE